jgi:hypothetical protein
MSVWCKVERPDVIPVLTQVVGSIFARAFLDSVRSSAEREQASEKESLDDPQLIRPA